MYVLGVMLLCVCGVSGSNVMNDVVYGSGYVMLLVVCMS